MKTNNSIKHILGGLVLTFAGWNAYAQDTQNLVANASMSGKHINDGYGQICKTETWSNANGGTVDLFDKTENGKCVYQVGIPKNYMGYQPMSQIGENYAGIIAYYDDGANNAQDSEMVACLGLQDGYKRYTEYLQGQFNQPMEAGKVYQVSFKVSLADKSGRAVSCLGALITNDKVEQKTNTFLAQQPQFISHRVIDDTANWVTLYGAYIANGGEKFITIGCFNNEGPLVVEDVVAKGQMDSRKAYYYISDVNVAPYIAKPNMEAIVGVDYVELMDLRFATNSSVIEPKYDNELDEVASWMVKHPEMSFFVAGYTDKTGGDAINDPLSVSRAKAVKTYLVSKGVKESNLITEGFGSNNPVDDRIKSRRNRRVEIYLYSVNTVTQR